jgi:hypothetical protein
MDTVSCRMVSISLTAPPPVQALEGQKLIVIPQIHQNMVPLRPEVHCPHIGPLGGGMCVDDRTYIGNLEENYFVNTPFLAPGLEGGVFS